jgi:hypothetical protein
MATPNVSPAKLRLAAALRSLQQIQEQGKAIVRSAELERRERESLIAAGYIHPIVKGWYFVSRPEADSDETTTWSAAMPEFIIGYCNARFSDMWHLSPAHSILAHVGATALPPQVVVHAPRAGNRILKLPGERSLLLYQSPDFPAISEIEVRAGLRILSIPSALVRIPEPFYQTASTEAHLALAMLPDSSDLNRELVTTGRSVVAGRLIGALRAIGRPELADDIGSTMRAAGYVIQETNPFLVKPPVLLNTRVASPYINRLHIMWRVMREEVLRHFPSDRGLRVDVDAYAHSVKRHYRDDAYHSLSIEGYRVTDALIERVATGVWSPAQHARDADAKNAMAAHGYWRAFESVLQSLSRVLSGENPGAIGRADHGAWYRELFGPSVDACSLRPHLRRSISRGARRTRPLLLRFRTPLHGWQRTHRAVSHERHARFRRLSMDHHPRGVARAIHHLAGFCQRPWRHRTFRRIHRRRGTRDGFAAGRRESRRTGIRSTPAAVIRTGKIIPAASNRISSMLTTR